MNEKISALIDHHTNPGQRPDLFNHILIDDGARKTWQHYHLIGSVLRGQVGQTGADLSERIRARLEDEPTVLAPAELPAPEQPAPVVTRADAWKSAGMLALAASVALMAVIALKPATDGGSTTHIAHNDAGAGFEQAHFEQAGFEQTRFEQTHFEQARFEQEFGEMLSQHGEFTSSPGLNGLVAYAKLVSNEPIER